MNSIITIRSYQDSDLFSCLSLWNSCCHQPDFLYKSLNDEDFNKLFVRREGDIHRFILIAEREGDFAGFAGGTTLPDKGEAYLTGVVVSEKYRRQGIGRALILNAEELIKENPALKQVELSFFNPSALGWIVPGTPGHDHPNAPGIDVASGAYLFFKNMGYRDRVYQNSFYLSLDQYEISPSIRQSRDRLVKEGITIENYNPEKHRGLSELFDDLGNEDWRNRIMENIEKINGGDPVLVVVYQGIIYGFAGPVYPEKSGRGYFSGIGVHHSLRGKGAGKLLFASLCLKEREAGATFMTFFTGETNPARNIYEAAQFKIVRTWANMIKILQKD